jgi:Uma2 family endonuclease
LILHAIREYLNHHDLGVMLGADGTLRILPNQIREPDVAFLSWRHFPQRKLPRDPIPAIAPDLAVEVLSSGNTPAEMERKLREYFQAGTRLVWYVDPDSSSVTVYESVEHPSVLTSQDVLRGGGVLPGFEHSIGELFRRAGQRE